MKKRIRLWNNSFPQLSGNYQKLVEAETFTWSCRLLTTQLNAFWPTAVAREADSNMHLTLSASACYSWPKGVTEQKSQVEDKMLQILTSRTILACFPGRAQTLYQRRHFEWASSCPQVSQLNRELPNQNRVQWWRWWILFSFAITILCSMRGVLCKVFAQL